MLLLMSILGALLIFFLAMVLARDKIGFLFGMVLLLLAYWSFLTFGTLCVEVPVDTISTTNKPCEIAKGYSTIFARDISGMIVSSTEHLLFIADEKDIMVKRTSKFNSYGIELDNNNQPIIYTLITVGKKELERKE